MVQNPFGADDTPDAEAVLTSLDDPTCRQLVQTLDEPMTVSELAEEADVPLSTTYRKLDLLDEASLLETQTKVRQGGHHQTLYRVAFEEVSFQLTRSREFDVSIVRAPEEPEERLASMWSELRRET